MRTKLLALAMVLGLLAAPVQAHTLERDGSISAVLHIDPNDDPIAQKPAGLYFDFNDLKGNFSLAQCDCQVIIAGATQPAVSLELSQDDATHTAIRYTFPERDVYAIVLNGTAKNGSFEPFHLHFNQRVDQIAGRPSPLHSLPFGISLLVIVLAVYWYYGSAPTNATGRPRPKRR